MTADATYKIVALYKFVALEDYKDLQIVIKDRCDALGIRGTLLLAREGLNGTISGSHEAIDSFMDYITSDPVFQNRFSDIDAKYSFADEPPFLRMRVRLKKEIVAIHADEADPTVQVGTYIEPQDWNSIITDPDVIVIDTRNDYEYKIGTFLCDSQGETPSINPETNTFGEFPDYVQQNLSPKAHKKVAMFCTGGIRCEKASSYMLAHGFEEVYHLKGGILRYLEEVPKEDSLWQGECFVFDERVSVGHGLEVGPHQLCHACRMPLSPDEAAHADFIEGVQCHYCKDTKSNEARKRAASRQHQMELARKKGQAHIGADARQHAVLAKERKLQAKEDNRQASQ